jgi:hypothetical protein
VPGRGKQQKPGKFTLREASDLFGKQKEFKKDGIWRGEFTNPVVVAEDFCPPQIEVGPHDSAYKPHDRIPLKPWLKFLGIWLGDGTLYHDERKGTYSIDIRQDKKVHSEVYDEIVSLAKQMGFRPFHYGRYIRIYSKQLYDYLKNYWKPKKVPEFVKKLKPEYIRILLEGIVASDGYINHGTKVIDTTSKQLADDIQELALKAGWSANIRNVNMTKYTKKIKGRVINSIKPQYRLVINEHQNTPIINPKSKNLKNKVEEWVDYDGYVYCVTVPNHVIYVRRNGKPVWCGNSDHGGCPKTGRFEINRWLIKKGLLNVTYLQKRHMKQLEMMKAQNPNLHLYKDQVGIHTPFVQIEDDSKFISVDLFDACVDVLDATEDEIEQLRKDLMDTGHFKAVYRKHELYGEDCDPDIPELIPDRKEGILVSCNVHPRAEEPDAESIVNLRDGDHSPYGCYGGTYEFNSQDIHPWELYSIVDEMTQDLKPKEQSPTITPEEEREILKRLEKLGYA